MVSFPNVSINKKNTYTSFDDDIANDFLVPLLSNAKEYNRGVGFFSLSSINLTFRGIRELEKNSGTIRIITSPNLSKEDIEEIRRGYVAKEELIARNIYQTVDSFEKDLDEVGREKLSYFATLIKFGVANIKIAFTKNLNSMFHIKTGILKDNFGNVISFEGSLNETYNGYIDNYDSINVFYSWMDTTQLKFTEHHDNLFESLWNDNAGERLEVIEFPEAAKKKLLEYSKESLSNFTDESVIFCKNPQSSSKNTETKIFIPPDVEFREYQEDAISNWEKNNYRGLFAMATGTGKTYTALGAIEKLFRKKHRLAIVIVCPYQHLVMQWNDDAKKFGLEPILGFSSSPQKDWKKNLSIAIKLFNYKKIDLFCFLTTLNTYFSFSINDSLSKLKTDSLLVVDEVHNIGASTYRKNLNNNFIYRLGVSATIERYKDKEGTQAILDYFGEKCIDIDLDFAIRKGYLSKYEYFPIVISLTPEELEHYCEITKTIIKLTTYSSSADEDDKYKEKLKKKLLERARIISSAKNKIKKFLALIATPEIFIQVQNVGQILVYCGSSKVESDYYNEQDIKQLDEIVSELNKKGISVSQFTSKENSRERERIKKAFESGLLKILVAIKCLDEGVNIPSIRMAFILASTTNPKEYIQRRGRVLRNFDGKDKAQIYDFITLPYSLDNEAIYINDEVKKLTKGLVIREFKRIQDFVKSSVNKGDNSKLSLEIRQKFSLTNEDLENEFYDTE